MPNFQIDRIAALTPKRGWVRPAVARQRAGEAENGYVQVREDAIFSYSS